MKSERQRRSSPVDACREDKETRTKERKLFVVTQEVEQSVWVSIEPEVLLKVL